MTAEAFALRLVGARRSGGRYIGHCPAHADERESLSFADGERGLVVKCHAGCSAATIAQACGLRLSDFFNGNAATARSASRVVAEHEYRDEDGALRYVVERRAPKAFLQRRPDGRGGWIWNLDGVRRVLYRLPELAGQQTVYVVEGKRDAEALAALGIPATTNAGGAGKWTDDYTAQLTAAGVERVVILPDNDRAGQDHARVVAKSCLVAGLTVKLIQLAGLPPKGDVSGWLATGHTREALAELVKAAPVLTLAELEPGATKEPTADDGGLTLTSLRDLLREPEEAVPWLVEGRLPAGGLSLLAGKPKAGKSTVARCLALAVARGEPWLGFKATLGPVIYLALEEKRAEVRRHFAAMGARDPDPVFVMVGSSPADGLARLRVEAERRRPVLIIVDPILRMVRVKDANDYATMTAALEPLLALARETGAHVLLVHHAGKGERADVDAALGSTAIAGAPDTILVLKRSERYRTLSTVQRYGEDLEEMTLTLDPDTRAVGPGVSRQEAEKGEAERAILDYLARQSQPVDEPAIMEAVEGGKTKVKRAALRALVDRGSVARTGAGKNGDPHRYADSRFSFPPIPGNEETRNRDEGLSPDGDAIYSRPHETGPGRPLAEFRERESEAVEEVEL